MPAGASYVAFSPSDDGVSCDGVPLATIAASVGTPTHVYAARTLDAAFGELLAALPFPRRSVFYAVKANDNLAVLARLRALGAGADVVSGGELARVLYAGFPPDRVVFSGVGKRDEELEAALEAGIRAVHVESAAELDVLERLAAGRGRRVPIALRINPDIDAGAHPYLSTGHEVAKFGVDVGEARGLLGRIARSETLALEGLACHVGSQLASGAPLAGAARVLGELARDCAAAGLGVQRLDLGGGWPVAYGGEAAPVPSPAELGRALLEGLGDAGVRPDQYEVSIEPGRALVAAMGGLLTRVLYVKPRGGRTFAVVDAAMTELVRPALYGAHHEVRLVSADAPSRPCLRYDVVGPVCETGDFLALDRVLPRLARGDLLLVASTGAYAASMSSRYNARPRAAEVLVEGAAFRVVRDREPVTDLWRHEHL